MDYCFFFFFTFVAVHMKVKPEIPAVCAKCWPSVWILITASWRPPVFWRWFVLCKYTTSCLIAALTTTCCLESPVQYYLLVLVTFIVVLCFTYSDVECTQGSVYSLKRISFDVNSVSCYIRVVHTSLPLRNFSVFCIKWFLDGLKLFIFGDQRLFHVYKIPSFRLVKHRGKIEANVLKGNTPVFLPSFVRQK